MHRLASDCEGVRSTLSATQEISIHMSEAIWKSFSALCEVSSLPYSQFKLSVLSAIEEKESVAVKCILSTMVKLFEMSDIALHLCHAAIRLLLHAG